MASSGDDAAPRGLLIDWGGVMTSNMFETFSGFCKREGLSPDVVAKQFRNDPASRELLVGLETGVLPEEQFQVEFAAILGVPPSELIDRMFADGRLDEPMIDAVRNARRAGIKTCLLSNSWGTRRYDRALLAELFDGIVISGEVGIRKPTPEIYELAAQRIGLEPRQCVFVDDLRFNLDPAAALGMTTILHRDSEQTIAELERLFGVDLQ
ncbi:MAG TPA: HAD family phosphatase [Solirubrobacteraceae bacterium]|nr:HAD family phosphatase [Solirubrobacteraceae bacterium]